MKRYRAIAEYYDAEYADRPMLRRDVPFFLRHLPRRRQSVLELCVGTARAAIPIAQAGHRVVGVDYARDMLAIARRKRDFVGLTERELSLVHADVKQLNLRQQFDRVCVFFNTFLSFTTLAEQDRVLKVARRHLKGGGRLWLDVFNPDLVLLSRSQSRDLEPRIFYVPQLQRTVFSTTDVRRDPAAQTQRVTFHYRWFDDVGRPRHQRVAFLLTWLFPRELQILLERNGLHLERLYGNHDGSKLGPDSPRIIACCSRS